MESTGWCDRMQCAEWCAHSYSVFRQGLCSSCSGPPSGPEISFPQGLGYWLPWAHSWVTLEIVFSWRELPCPHYSPFPGAAYIQCLIEMGCRGPAPLPQTGQIWRIILAPELFMRLDEASVWLHYSSAPLCPIHLPSPLHRHYSQGPSQINFLHIHQHVRICYPRSMA